MIYIEEKLTTKLPAKTSLYITFDFKTEIVEIIKSLTVREYLKDIQTWECPITELANLIELLNPYDNISLKLMKGVPKQDIDYSKVKILHNFKTKPYQYQIDGVKYGLTHDKFLLLDAPGLGKSKQMIDLAVELKQTKGIKHCLIVCGINTLKTNWKREITVHSDLTGHILGERVNRKGKTVFKGVQERLEDLKKPIKDFFIITNIETLRNADIVKALNSDKYNKIDMIVFDEIHKANNPTAQQSKGLLKLTKAKYRIGLSGTILTNSPLNAYMPLKWLDVEHCNFSTYKRYYCKYSGTFNNIIAGYQNINILKSQLNDCSLRRTKDILDLPEKHIIHEFLDMDDAQVSFYNAIAQNVVLESDSLEEKNTTGILALITRLRQATVCPTILEEHTKVDSAKHLRACELAEEILNDPSEKLVIFSVFKKPLYKLQKALEKYNPLLCLGDVKDEVITENINQFQNDSKHRVLLCTCSKMGTGVTLNRASFCIFLDCPWTFAEALQCEDRIYRVGTKKPVFIYYLWCNGTIDTHVKDIVESKAAISDYIVDNKLSNQMYQKLISIIEDLKEGVS